MNKKNKSEKNKQKSIQEITAREPQKTAVKGISRLGKKLIFAGIIIVAAGFVVLSKTDSYGQNWASVVSPFLIIGGYITIGLGIVIPDPEEIT